MRVLVACEYSGIVRESFKAKGHYAVSCDFLPTEIEGLHYQGDVLDIIEDGWDLMIAHPPCTYLSTAAAHAFNEEKYGDKAKERKVKRQKAYEFVLRLYNSPVPKVAIENPVGFLSTMWRKPDQIVKPFQFGEPEYKKICLWLKNLPVLKHGEIVQPTIYGYWQSGKNKGKPVYYTNNRRTAKERSKFFVSVAKAMAEQWG